MAAFIPLYDRIFIERIEDENASSGGILIPDNAKEKPSRGRVLATGPGKRNDAGERIPLDVKPNNIVAFGKYAGTEIKLDGKEYVILREDDILGIIE
jgi:chaperonin GroES